MSRVKKIKKMFDNTLKQNVPDSPRLKKVGRVLKMRESQVRKQIKHRSPKGKQEIKRLVVGSLPKFRKQKKKRKKK